MCRSLLAIAFFFAVIPRLAMAQTYTTHGFSFPQQHPRLWIPYGSTQLSQAKTWAAANPVNCAGINNSMGQYACEAFYHVTTGSDCSAPVKWAQNTNQAQPAQLTIPPPSSGGSLTVGEVASFRLTYVDSNGNESPWYSSLANETTVITTGNQTIVVPSAAASSGEVSYNVYAGLCASGTCLVTKQNSSPVAIGTNFRWTTVVAGAALPRHSWPPEVAQTSTRGVGVDVMRNAGENAMLVFDWCHDQWTAAQISNFVSAMQTWISNIDQQNYSGYIERCIGPVSRGECNGNTVPGDYDDFYHAYLRDDLEWGIVSYGDNGTGPSSNADNAIDWGMRRWSHMVTDFEALGNSGIPMQGTEYGRSLCNYLLIPFETIALGGRDMVNELPFMQAVNFYAIYSTPPIPTLDSDSGRTEFQQFTFGDDQYYTEGRGVYGSFWLWQDWLNWASNHWSSSGTTGELARLLYNTVTADSGTYHPFGISVDPWVQALDKAPAAAADYSSLPLDYYGTGISYAYVRKAWDNSSTIAFLQMGSADANHGGTGHFHDDQGNFTLWRNGYFVDRETTCYGDKIAGEPNLNSDANLGCSGQGYGSIGHNVVVFTNVALGMKENATRLLPTHSKAVGTGVVHRLASAANYFYGDTDLTNAYLFNSGFSADNTGVVGHVEREFIFVRPLETLVVLDRILTQNQTVGGSLTASQVITTFVNHCEVNPMVVDSHHFTCNDHGQVAAQTVLEPTSPTYRVINERSCTRCSKAGQYRIDIDNSGTAHRYDLDVIQSYGSKSGCPLTATNQDSNTSDPTIGTFTVTLTPHSGSGCTTAGMATTIVFNKSLCSSGAGECSSGGTINVAGSGSVSLPTNIEPIAYTGDGPVWGGVADHDHYGLQTSTSR